MKKQIGKRKNLDAVVNPIPHILYEADQWLKTVSKLRQAEGVCKKGLYKFKTFEEADQWMETMILSSSLEYRP